MAAASTNLQFEMTLYIFVAKWGFCTRYVNIISDNKQVQDVYAGLAGLSRGDDGDEGEVDWGTMQRESIAARVSARWLARIVS